MAGKRWSDRTSRGLKGKSFLQRLEERFYEKFLPFVLPKPDAKNYCIVAPITCCFGVAVMARQ
jgi:hypothetical protein